MKLIFSPTTSSHANQISNTSRREEFVVSRWQKHFASHLTDLHIPNIRYKPHSFPVQQPRPIVPSTRQDHLLNANRPHTPLPPPTRSTYAIHHEQHTRNSLGGDSDTALLDPASYHPAVYHNKRLSIAGARNIHNGSLRHDARTSDRTAVLLLARLATQHLDHHHVGNRRHISRSLCKFRSNTECTRRVGHTMVRLHLIHRSIALIFCCSTGRWEDIGAAAKLH